MPHISAEGVCVEFPIWNPSHRSLKNAVLRATTGGRLARESSTRVVVQALSDLSFEFARGDRIGLVGNNGSGKTTLLRVLSGIYEPVRGRLEVSGRVSSLLDLSLGMDHEATGLENIVLRGVLMGLPPVAIQAKVNEIAEFSELGDYLSMPIRTYSSGMLLRLAFAVSTSVAPEILLLDEWLSVGDAAFRDKAERRLLELIESSAIMVLASHDESLIRRFCSRMLRLEHGRAASAS
ncbi:MAG: ABC transporter ATP-binding protein [Betaproteobacteria bacterium]|nr:MAG: ABC transporter ATP-binding protein [Betaproteobacteria bacterium]